MNEFAFTLRLSASSLGDEEIKTLYSHVPDCIHAERDGRVYVAFGRAAETFADAVVAAIEDVERALPGTQVLELEPEELLFASDIAERTGRTRESIRLLIEGRRGPGAFPPPAHVVGDHKLWRWKDVAAWFSAYEETGHIDVHEPFVASVNALLTARRSRPALSAEERSALRRLALEVELAPSGRG